MITSDISPKTSIRHSQDFSSLKHRGTLYITIGNMFSGKTTWLNGELTREADKGFHVLKIIHDSDVREDVSSSSNTGTTHNSTFTTLSNKVDVVRTRELSSVDVTGYHFIGVDESQFFDDLIEVVEKWIEEDGKHVRVAGLDGDKNKKIYGKTLFLIPMCDRVNKISADCKLCLQELEAVNFHGNILSITGPFTKYLGCSVEQTDIGGSDKYIPTCRFHHAS